MMIHLSSPSFSSEPWQSEHHDGEHTVEQNCLSLMNQEAEGKALPLNWAEWRHEFLNSQEDSKIMI